MSMTAWPELSWEVSSRPVEWLVERVGLMATRARALELALEQGAEAGEVELSRVADRLGEWEHCAANVFMYAGLGDARQVAEADVPYHAEELAKVYRNLIELRGALLTELGPSAEKVLAREAQARVGADDIHERAGELPAFTGETDKLTGETVALPELSASKVMPVSADELRLRHNAELKPLPESCSLGALLAHVPSDWVKAIFATLDLPSPANDDLTAGTRSAALRGLIHEHLRREPFLKQVVFALGEEERALLEALLAAGGSMRQAEVASKFGTDESDGFYWLERPPSSPLSCLRRAGLAFVGSRGGQLSVVVPAEVAELAAKILAAEAV